MNKIILIGNLAKDPELTETSSGIAICRFSLAVNRPYADSDGERKADFFNVTAWRTLAETAAKYTHKGSKVAVEGSVQVEQKEGNDGVKRTYFTVVAQSIEFLTPKQNDDEPPAKTTPKKAKLQSFDDDGDIPF